MQTICTSLQTDNHTNTSSLSFYRPYALPDAQPTVKALKAQATNLSKLMEFEHEADRRASSSVAADFVNVTHETEWLGSSG